MRADLWVKVDVRDFEEIKRIKEAQDVLQELRDQFGKIGYAGTEEKEKALDETIDTLQMVLDGELF